MPRLYCVAAESDDAGLTAVPSPHSVVSDPNDDRALPVSSGDSSGYAFDASDDTAPQQSSNAQLPAAEPLSSNVRAEAEPLIALLGLDLTQSLYSRHWQLRADAVQVVTQLVADEASPVRAAGTVSMPVLLRDLSRVLQRTLTDKAAQVFVHACRLLEVVLREAAAANSSNEAAGAPATREETRGLVESVSRVMADRLSSSNAREREQASQILTYLALHNVSPPATVPNVLLAPLKKKEKDHPTPLRARCLVLQTLVRHLELHDAGGLSLTQLLRFALLCLTHRDAGVRDGAFNLVALACQQVDRKKVDAQLSDVPASTLASLDQRIADVREGRYTVVTAGLPDRPYDDRVTTKEQSHSIAAAAANAVSPRRHTEPHKPNPGKHGADSSPNRPQPHKREDRMQQQPHSQPHSQPHGQQPEKATGTAHSTKQRQPRLSQQPQQSRLAAQQANSPASSKSLMAAAASKAEEDSFSDDQYDDEQHAPPPQQQPSGRGGDSNGSVAVPNAGSPSHYRLSHAGDIEQGSGQDDSSAAAAEEAADGSYPPLANKCQFCGLEDESFTEDALDLHYWQACPMLLSCPHCEQVVEIPTFAEHLTSECESGGQWAACKHCGWVVPDEPQLTEHEADCGGVRAGWVVCQLCCKEVDGSEDGWRQHLLVQQCSANVRTSDTAVEQ